MVARVVRLEKRAQNEEAALDKLLDLKLEAKFKEPEDKKRRSCNLIYPILFGIPESKKA